MGCVVKSLKEFKNLEKVYGPELAESFVIGYSRSVKKLMPNEDFYYPTLTEVKNWLTESKNQISRNVTRAVEVNPFITEKALLSMLKGVVSRFSENKKLYVTRGNTNTGSTILTAEALRDVYENNLKIVKALENRFPNIIQTKQSQYNEYTTEVIFTPVTSRIEADATKDRAAEVMALFTEFPMSKQTQEIERAREIAGKLAQKFAQAFKMNYNVINSAEAEKILENSPTPYNGEAGFFYNNTVYLIADKFTLDTVIHEFAHPLIKGIALQNRKLFDKLYAELSATATGKAIISEVAAGYENLEVGSDRFKEEVLVRAIERDAVQKLEKATKGTEAEFKNFMLKLIYALKQVLKKMVKKVDLKNLNSTTTVESLADMLISEDFEITNLVLNEQDFAEFSKDLKSIAAQFEKVKSSDLQKAIDRMYAEVKYELDVLYKSPIKLKNLLESKEGVKFIKYIADALQKYQTVTEDPSKIDPENALKALADQENEFMLRTKALVEAIESTEIFVQNVQKVLENMDKTRGKVTSDDIAKVMYYQNFLLRQDEMLEDVRINVDVPRDSDFMRKITGTQTLIKDALNNISNIQQEFAGQFFEKAGEYMAENIDEFFRKNINKILKPAGNSQEVIDAMVNSIIEAPLMTSFDPNQYGIKISPAMLKILNDEVKQYNQKRLTREQYDSFLKGEREDLGYIASMIIPLKNIDDPIIGTFVREMTIQLSDMMSKTLKERDQFASKIDPLLEAAGYNKNNVAELGKKLLLEDMDGYRDPKTGEWKEYKRYTYHDKFKNWRYDRGKLGNDYELAKESKDKQKIKDAYNAIKDFDKKYMYRKFKDEVYAVEDIWTSQNRLVDPFTKKEIVISPDVSFEAYLIRDAAIGKMNILKTTGSDKMDELLEYTPADEARAEYESLYEVTHPDGTPKAGKELEMTLVIKHYRAESRKFREFVEDPDGLQKDLNGFVDLLAAKGITMDGKTKDLFNDELERFFNRNMRVAYTKDYIQERSDLFRQLRELTNKPGIKSDVAQRMADLTEERYKITNKVIDKDRQVNGLQLTESQRNRLKEIEVELVKLNDEFDTKSGLSKQDKTKLEQYQNRLVNGPELTADERSDYDNLINIKNEMGLGAIELEAMRSIFSQLKDLSYKEPTEHYITAINYVLRGLDMDLVTIDNADEWINSPKVIEARANSEKFDAWFKQNHYEKEVWDPAIEGKVTKIFRTAAWNVSKPVSENSYQYTTLTHPITGEQIKRRGVPGGRYGRSRVKKEFYTQKIVGKTVDNKGNFLPKEYDPASAESAYDKKYRNDEYYNLKASNSPTFKLLEGIKEQYLKFQENGLVSSRLYYDYANLPIERNIELIKNGGLQEKASKAGRAFKRAGQFVFGKETPIGAEEQGFEAPKGAGEMPLYNYNVEATTVGTDLLGNPLSKIPVAGLYRLDINDVSLDFLRSIGGYQLSLNTQKTLSDLEPTALAIQQVLNNPDNAIKDMSRVSRQIKKVSGNNSFIKTDTNRRADTFNYVIEKIFYGKVNAEYNENNPRMTKLTNSLMNASSRSFIALDLVSAAKNRYGMLFNAMIETAGLQYITPKSAAQGKYRAFTSTIYLMSKGIYTYGPKALDMQMMEYFDPITGKTKKDFSRSASRTFLSDMLDMTWMYDARKLAEVEAGLQLYWGMMYNKYIDQVDENGNTNKIPYANAFELGEDGIAKLKDGIDLEYSMHKIEHTFSVGDSLESIAKQYKISVEKLKENNNIENLDEVQQGDKLIISNAKEFNNFKLVIQGVGKKLNGLMDEMDSPRANKYLGWRLFSFYRAFAIPQFLNRFQYDTSKENYGGHVYDFNLGVPTKGYYISAAQASIKLFKTGFKYWPSMTDEEKASYRKVFAEGAMLAMFGLIAAYMFGYDDEDEDRFEKMKQREKEYGAMGWMANHLLYQTLAVQSENELFVPIVGTGQLYKFVEPSSYAGGPVIGNSIKIAKDLYNGMIGDESAMYTQDVGPYSWQEEGDWKLWNHVGGMFGIRGRNYSAIQSIKNKEISENL